MIIAGLDPGTRKVGYAVIEIQNNRVKVRDLGTWNLMERNAQRDLGERLEILSQNCEAFLKTWNPRWIGFEKAVAFKNITSAFKLSEARGVVRLSVQKTLDQAHRRIIELSPTEVKRQATGLGLASKSGVVKSMTMRFPEILKIIEAHGGEIPSDSFDALAMAWTAYLKSKSLLFSDSKVRSL